MIGFDPSVYAGDWDVDESTVTVNVNPSNLMGYNARRIAAILSINGSGGRMGVSTNPLTNLNDGVILVNNSNRLELTFQKFGGLVHQQWYVFAEFGGELIHVVEVVYKPQGVEV